jgi:hypothetical protein
MTKKEKRLKKEYFYNNILPIIQNDWEIEVFEHFIKINIQGKVCDYYPGAGKLHILGKTYSDGKWVDISIERFCEKLEKIR